MHLSPTLINLVASNNKIFAAAQHLEVALGGRMIEPVIHAASLPGRALPPSE